jgi:NuA3 HAT complex component NTO1
METARDAAASGGCSIHDLPPSNWFKFAGSNLVSALFMPLPARKRAFPPLPKAAPISVCLPTKKCRHAWNEPLLLPPSLQSSAS